ncbi:helix-turn-helix transcriptional regulator [Conexibacter woesei]|uniref:Transcriptional regulator, LuxR family n=1 Tax=Conexibacter woesei (strain DSM 14684 / CCUG 47730 / CIP 108061 / JCM 11494 / NBRC 100937 / ID131577) TaxID=469383 RepID=D3FEQ8_CONWI|nr:helix-turn-helix transcriptional regulator [Conexibacter woesei]ADB49732.1 transcriptional regulator, LuxR family [Conexibacter woesei DSM 14684]
MAPGDARSAADPGPISYVRLSAAVAAATADLGDDAAGVQHARTLVVEDMVLVVVPGDTAPEVLSAARDRLVPVIEREARRRVERATVMTGEHAATVMFALAHRDLEPSAAAAPTLMRSELHDRAEIAIDLDGRITAWGPDAESLLGWPAAAGVGAPLAMLVSERSEVRVDELLAAVTAGRPLGDRRTAWRTKEGMVMPLTLSAAPLLRAGAVIGGAVVVECSGLTGWSVAAHDELDVERLAGVGTWKWRFASGRMTWSPQLVALHGAVHDPDEPNANMLAAYAHPDDRERLRAALVHAALVPLPASVDYRLLRTDGRLRYVHLHAEIVCDENGVAEALVGTVQDVTELRSAADVAERLAAELVAAGPPAAAGEEAFERRLGARQHEVLGLMAEGLGNAEIATRLFLSESTVKWHVKKILRELHAANRAEAVAHYVRAVAARR